MIGGSEKMIWVLYQPECYFNYELHKFKSFKEFFEFLMDLKEAYIVIPSTKEEKEAFIQEMRLVGGWHFTVSPQDFFIYVYSEIE